jgi:hypothetical protein
MIRDSDLFLFVSKNAKMKDNEREAKVASNSMMIVCRGRGEND